MQADVEMQRLHSRATRDQRTADSRRRTFGPTIEFWLSVIVGVVLSVPLFIVVRIVLWHRRAVRYGTMVGAAISLVVWGVVSFALMQAAEGISPWWSLAALLVGCGSGFPLLYQGVTRWIALRSDTSVELMVAIAVGGGFLVGGFGLFVYFLVTGLTHSM